MLEQSISTHAESDRSLATDTAGLWAAFRRYDMVLLYALIGAVVAAIGLALNDIPNFRAFAQAARDLAAGRDIYAASSGYYMYSPTFAFLFGMFAWMPETVGEVAWNVLNFSAAGCAMHWLLPEASRRRGMSVALVGILMVTDADQSNLLITGLMILATLAYWRGRNAWGASAVVAGAVVKIFPAAIGVWALTAKSKVKAIVWIVAMSAVAAILPLLVTSPSELLMQYAAWKNLLQVDYVWRGWSVSNALFEMGLDLPVKLVEVSIMAVAIAPILIFGQRFSAQQRLLALASLLITFNLANHKSEFESYVIGAVGLGIWYVAGPPTWSRLAFVAFAILSTAPLYPMPGGIPGDWHALLKVKRAFFPTRLIPFVILWGLLQWRLWVPKAEADEVALSAN